MGEGEVEVRVGVEREVRFESEVGVEVEECERLVRMGAISSSVEGVEVVVFGEESVGKVEEK